MNQLKEKFLSETVTPLRQQWVHSLKKAKNHRRETISKFQNPNMVQVRDQ